MSLLSHAVFIVCLFAYLLGFSNCKDYERCTLTLFGIRGGEGAGNGKILREHNVAP